MSFRALFYFFIFLSLTALILDYILTIYGFSNHFAIMEINPFIMFFMRFTQPFIAATIVFHMILILVLGSYLAVRRFLGESPYNGGLRDVWNHLMRSEGPETKDIAIFALIALYSYFIYIHIVGAWTWIDFLRTVGT